MNIPAFCQLMSSKLLGPTNKILVAVDLNNNMLGAEWKEEQSCCPRYCLLLIVLTVPLMTAPNIIT